MAAIPTMQPDVTLLLDMEGVIREATLSPAMQGESVDGWLGRPWVEIAGDVGGDKVKRMVEDARASGISAFRQINQRFPSGLEIPIEFTTVLLGGRAGMLAIGKNLQAVAELQSRLIAAQQTMERDYWKLREIETRYRLVFDASDEAVVIVSPANLRIVEANRSAVEALNSSRRRNEDLAGREFLHEVASEDREAVREMLNRVRERGKALSILVHLGPDAKSWMLRGSLIASDPGHVFLLQFTAAANAPVEREQDAGSTIENLIDRLPDGFVALDETGVIQHANQAFLDLVQIGSKGSAIGESLGRWLWQPGADLNALLANVERHGTVRLFTTTVRGELGTDTEIEISAAQNDNEERKHIGVLLRNVARRLPVYGEGDLLRTALGSASEQIGKSSLRKLVKNAVSIVEQHYVKQALELAKGNRTATAELLGLSRQSLYAKLNLYGLDDKGPDSEEPTED
ncbi:transcriptional regulator PpsR [Bradyrhizobium sp.]|jgi:transcriptional regulator PpsR|uniref:transcriptional regulator PpsR n=1 Tax=Bradyrhizobium sp. TaxID=376 RepID=UPI003C21B737